MQHTTLNNNEPKTALASRRIESKTSDFFFGVYAQINKYTRVVSKGKTIMAG